MPTERFFNLPEEKRARITQAIFEEMCRVPYDEISINKIIQNAEIPRGSFYQYFENKDELLTFMLKDFQKQLFTIATETLIEVDGDIFRTFSGFLRKVIAIGEQEKYCTLLQNISYGIKYNHIHDAKILQKRGKDYLNEMFDLTNMSEINIQTKEDFFDLAYVLALLIWSAGIDIFLDLTKKEEILTKTEKRINMIKYGVMKEETK